MRTNRIGTLLLLALLSVITPLSAAKKALVIGNADYAVKPLRNPLNDSLAMAEKLHDLGFQVTHRDDLTRKVMRKEIRDFVQTLNKGDDAFFYFSGHGVQVDNKNYLLPIANDIQMEYEVSDGAVSLDFILSSLAHADSDINIVVLDACRDNPFPSRFKNTSRGLAKLNQQIANTFVAFSAFSASSGGVSDDGDKDNGVYTQALLNHIATPNIGLPEMFTRVRQEVYTQTQAKQLPEEVNRLLTTVYLVEYHPDPVYYTNSIGMKFKTIPAGSFYMGSCRRGKSCPTSVKVDYLAVNNESSLHLVNISQNFQVGAYEVTVGQFKQFIVSADRKDLLTDDFRESNNHGADAAVSYVSWNDAQEFIIWLNNKEGGEYYRLPTEEEWEYAARAGTTTHYSWGNSVDQVGAYAWYYHNVIIDDYFTVDEKYAHTVGKKLPNLWGLYDMHGNVWEWVSDLYGKKIIEMVAQLGMRDSNPAEDVNRLRVIRGGGWGNRRSGLRSAVRSYDPPNHRSNALGLRLVRQP